MVVCFYSGHYNLKQKSFYFSVLVYPPPSLFLASFLWLCSVFCYVSVFLSVSFSLSLLSLSFALPPLFLFPSLSRSPNSLSLFLSFSLSLLSHSFSLWVSVSLSLCALQIGLCVVLRFYFPEPLKAHDGHAEGSPVMHSSQHASLLLPPPASHGREQGKCCLFSTNTNAEP